jgi:hypothetical protein
LHRVRPNFLHRRGRRGIGNAFELPDSLDSASGKPCRRRQRHRIDRGQDHIQRRAAFGLGRIFHELRASLATKSDFLAFSFGTVTLSRGPTLGPTRTRTSYAAA